MQKLKIATYISLLVMILNGTAQAASDSTMVLITGRAYDRANPERRLDDLMIINLGTSQGVFGKADGSFSVSINRKDTILIASTGYEYKRFTVSDSVYRSSYTVEIALTRLNVNLREVVIFSPRDLEAIYKDIEKLGYNRRELQIGGVDAISSPITFLYQEFSRLERLKRHNAERINNDKRREILKELLANYVAGDIIYLDDSEFDDFINYCNVPEQLMKTASQYDFCVYIKHKFELYRMSKH